MLKNNIKKIIIASTNQVKVAAVKELIQDYPLLSDAEILSKAVPSGVSDQPMSLEETAQGAKNRAESAFEEGSYSIGIESGIIQTPGCPGRYMDLCVCSFYNGKIHRIGLSCAFEIPPVISELILNEQMNLAQAAHRTQFTDNPSLGAAEGCIGILTKGRVCRKKYTQQALTMALIALENQEWFEEETVPTT